jgi:hypothetical protein
MSAVMNGVVLVRSLDKLGMTISVISIERRRTADTCSIKFVISRNA